MTTLARAAVTLIAAANLMSVGAANAQEFTNRTSCSYVAKLVEQENRAKLGELLLYIQNVMHELDDAHTENGEPGILSQLSDEGWRGMGATVAVHCQNHPKQTVYDSIAFVYTGVRDMELSLGVAR